VVRQLLKPEGRLRFFEVDDIERFDEHGGLLAKAHVLG
jgi:hypothetical protein